MINQVILRSNTLIQFEDLKDAVSEYKTVGHTSGKTEKIDAYLSGTVHAIADYLERFPFSDKEFTYAIRYANNSLKHIERYVTHKKITGGFSFPITFPFSSEAIEVVWNYDPRLKTRYRSQQNAFEKRLAGKPIIETLEPFMDFLKTINLCNQGCAETRNIAEQDP